MHVNIPPCISTYTDTTARIGRAPVRARRAGGAPRTAPPAGPAGPACCGARPCPVRAPGPARGRARARAAQRGARRAQRRLRAAGRRAANCRPAADEESSGRDPASSPHGLSETHPARPTHRPPSRPPRAARPCRAGARRHARARARAASFRARAHCIAMRRGPGGAPPPPSALLPPEPGPSSFVRRLGLTKNNNGRAFRRPPSGLDQLSEWGEPRSKHCPLPLAAPAAARARRSPARARVRPRRGLVCPEQHCRRASRPFKRLPAWLPFAHACLAPSAEESQRSEALSPSASPRRAARALRMGRARAHAPR